jgi:hypothetical protein
MDPIHKVSSSWHEFHGKVTSLQNADWNCGISLKNNSRHFVDNILTKSSAAGMEKKTEAELTEACLGDVMKVGPYILEDTSNGIKKRHELVQKVVDQGEEEAVCRKEEKESKSTY